MDSERDNFRAVARQDAGTGVSLSRDLAPLAAALFEHALRFDAADCHWPDRDRVVVPARGAPLAAQFSRLLGCGAGVIDAVPGPPGHALGAAVGLAIAERLLAGRFGCSLVDHRSWALLDAAELETGLALEAASLAGAARLSRLTALVALDGTGTACLAPFEALGWSVRLVPHGGAAEIATALAWAERSRRPCLIACQVPGEPLGDTSPPPAGSWARAGGRGATPRRAWLKRLARHPQRAEFERALQGPVPATWQSVLAGLAMAPPAGIATTDGLVRHALRLLMPAMPDLLCAETVAPQARGQAGRAVSFGSRVQAMAAALNGVAFHGGWLPVGDCCAATADLVRAAASVAAARRLRVLYLCRENDTADALAAWRAIPNLRVFRPADAAETLECGELALRRGEGPTVLMVSEVPLSGLPSASVRPHCARGGYVARRGPGRRRVTLIASGAELAVAMTAAARLDALGLRNAVVSLPCWDLFETQDVGYRTEVLGEGLRIGIEAGGGFGWERWLGADGVFIGPLADAPITPERVVAAVLRRLDTMPAETENAILEKSASFL